MAKVDFCVRTSELAAMRGDGRHDQARREAQALLREGFASRPFLRLVADMLEPAARGKGRPATPPARWLEIGEEFERMRDEGTTRERAIADLAEKFSASEATITRAVKIWLSTIEEVRKAR